MDALLSRRSALATLRLMLVVCVGTTGCSSSSDDDDPPPQTITQIPTPGTATLTASPTSLVVAPGTSATATITATSSNGAGIALSTLPPGTIGVTASVSPTSVASGGTATLTVSASAIATAATIPIQVMGTVNNLPTGFAQVSVQVPSATNLSLAASPSSATVARGTSLPVNLTATNAGNTSGQVNFSVAGAPPGITVRFPNGASCSIVALVSSCPGSMAIDVGTNAPLGPTRLTVTGTGLGQTPTATIDLTVTAAPTDFSIAMSPATMTLLPGQTAPATAQITRLGTGVGNVALSATGPAGVQLAFNPATASGATSAVTVTAASNAAPGTYTVVVRGDAGSASQTTPFTVNIADFSLRASETHVLLDPTDSCTTDIIITRLGSFPDNITFSVQGIPPGAVGVFVQNPVGPASGTAVLSIKTASLTFGTSYSLTVTGTAAGVSRSVALTLDIGYSYGGGSGGAARVRSRVKGERKAGGHASWPPARSD